MIGVFGQVLAFHWFSKSTYKLLPLTMGGIDHQVREVLTCSHRT